MQLPDVILLTKIITSFANCGNGLFALQLFTNVV